MLARPFDPVLNNGSSFIPEVGIAYGLEKPDLTFGFAWYAPYAMPNTWPADGPQRYASIWSSSWQLHFSLFVSAKLAPWLAVGLTGGLMVLRSRQSVKATAHVLADESVGLVHNDENPLYDLDIFVDAWERGKPWFNAGVMVMPAPWMRIGLGFAPGFRMRADAELTMDAEIEVWEDVALVIDTGDQIELEADLPPIIRGGVAIVPRDGLEFELDVHAELWSRVGASTLRGVGVDLTDLNDQIAALAPPFSDEIAAALGASVGPPGLDLHLAWTHFFRDTVIVRNGTDHQFTALAGIEANNTNDGTYRSSADIIGFALTIQPEMIHEAAKKLRSPFGF
jgi:long-subunit fatty acid transport protein